MNKEKMNQALSMLDDDVIADALEGKKRSTGGVTRRKLMVTLIAATLAVALLAGGIGAALSRTGGRGPIALLPPEDATVIRNVTTTLQVTSGTIYGSGNYPTFELQYGPAPTGEYALINDIELDRELYDSMVASNDPDRIWALELSISPNLYMTEEYIEREFAYWMTNAEAEDLAALVTVYEQFKNDFDIDALYAANKDKYELDELYKYFKNGTLEAALLNSDINELKAKAQEIWDECASIKRGHWKNLVPDVRTALEDFGIEYVEEDDSFIIFVTEGELLALRGFTGVKISNAKKYELTFAQIPTVTEWNGKKVSNKLADALAANEGKDVLFAVTAEPAAFSEMLDRSNYEASYLELFSELAKRPAYRKALEAVSADASKLEAAIAICGESIVADYLWDGYFDAARFDKDTVELSATVELMRSNLYRDAAEIYAEFAPYVRYIEINENGVVVFYVTAEELAAITTARDYCFKLAS